MGLKAVTKINGALIKSKPLKASLLMDPTSKEFGKSAKKSRLIIRNLGWDCTEEDLISAFEVHGLITDVNVPVTEKGKKLGYGFVQFSHPFEAQQAIRQMNEKLVKGRKVAVDWSVRKEQFKDAASDDEEDKSGDEKADDEKVEGSDNEESGKDDRADESDEDESDESMEVDDDDEEEAEPVVEKKKDKNFSSDVHEEKTVFLRNMDYDVTGEELGDFIKEKFGEIKYCKIVINHQTGMSKGSAFVQFINKADADTCIRMMNDDDESVILRGRRFTATIAMDRSTSNKIRKEKFKEKKEKDDKRNLHLANEGVIRPGTQAAVGLSELEVKKRTKIEGSKRVKLKNDET